MKRGIPVDEAKRKRGEQRDRERAEQPTGPKANGHAEPRFRLLGLDDLSIKPDDDWLIDGVLPSQGVGLIYGKYKSFKTFAALDLAWAVADQQRATWGSRRILKHGVVIYVVCEGQVGMRKRLLAYKLRHGDDELPLLWRIETPRPRLGAPNAIDVGELVTAIRQLFPHETIALVVIDTVARTLFREETNETLSAFLDNTEDISDKLGCLVLAVHHEGVDGTRPRGGTMLPAGTVVQLHVKRFKGQGCQLIVEEAKDTESGFGFTIGLQGYEFATDEHSEQRDSTLVVESVTPWAAKAEPDPNRKRGGGRPNRAHSLLATVMNQVIDWQGIEHKFDSDGPTLKAVNRDYVRNAYVRRRADLGEEGADREFRKVLGKAIASEQIITRELQSTVWLFWPNKEAAEGQLL